MEIKFNSKSDVPEVSLAQSAQGAHIKVIGVGGGGGNAASGSGSTVGGGGANAALGDSCAVGGGTLNTASGPYATVGGGAVNTAVSVGSSPGTVIATAYGPPSEAPTMSRITALGAYFWNSRFCSAESVAPVEAMIDLALERDFKLFFRQPFANEDQADALALMKHPYSVTTFSDSGAHVSQIMDSSLQTHLLSHWVRDEQAITLEEAVRMITYDTATTWGFHDRGLLREGMVADVVVFDPERIIDTATFEEDLSASIGVEHVFVLGTAVVRDGENVPGVFPGQAVLGRFASGP